jgi:hypothetical protein
MEDHAEARHRVRGLRAMEDNAEGHHHVRGPYLQSHGAVDTHRTVIHGAHKYL